MDIKINNRISAKEAREKQDSSIITNIKSQATEVYDKINKQVNSKDKKKEITLYNKCLLPDVKQMLINDGYIVNDDVKTGMNEYSTVIQW